MSRGIASDKDCPHGFIPRNEGLAVIKKGHLQPKQQQWQLYGPLREGFANQALPRSYLFWVLAHRWDQQVHPSSSRASLQA